MKPKSVCIKVEVSVEIDFQSVLDEINDTGQTITHYRLEDIAVIRTTHMWVGLTFTDGRFFQVYRPMDWVSLTPERLSAIEPVSVSARLVDSSFTAPLIIEGSNREVTLKPILVGDCD